MKIPNKKVEGHVPLNDQNLKWHVLAEILEILRNFKAENRKKLRKQKLEFEVI